MLRANMGSINRGACSACGSVSAAIAALLITVGTCSPDASAQDAAPAPEAGLEEVTVSARKRTESLQDVPLAITVLSDDFIAKNNIKRPEDIAALTPGFHYEQTGARYFNKPTIRGTSVNSISYRLQKTSIYVDGVVVTGSFGSLPFTDLKQVEVLKGPQSTAFGRGNLAGAINYITKTPTDVLSGNLSVQGREDDEMHVDGYLSGPLIEGKLKGYLSANYYSYGGPSGLKNALFGEQLGTERSRDVSAKLVGTFTDWLTVTARAFNGYDRDGLPTFQYINPADRTGDFTTPISQAASGRRTLAPIGATRGSSLAYSAPTNQMEYPGLRRFTKRYTLSADADMGFATLTAVAARNTLDETEQYPSLEGLSVPTIFAAAENPNPPASARTAGTAGFSANQAEIVEEYKDTQFELRLASNGNTRLKYSVGLNYFKFDQYELFTGFSFINTYTIRNTSGFGLLSFAFTDKLTASIEGRQARDEIGQVGVGFGVTTPRNASYNRFSPRITVNYKVTPDMMVYALASRGNSPGSFNTNAGLHAAAPQYDNIKEERITNYEIGIKSSWLNNRLTANLTAYRMDWKDQQLLVVIPYPNLTYSPTAPSGSINAQQFLTGQFTTNAGNSKLDGVELEIEARPTRDLSLRGTLAYVDAKYKDFCSPQAWLLNPTAPLYPNYIGCKQVAGKTLFQQPPLTASLLVSYEHALTDDWKGFVSTDWNYEDKKYGSEVNLNWTPPASVVNLHLGAEHKHLRLEAFVMNLTNEDGPVRTRFAVGGAAIAGNSTVPNGNYPNSVFQQLIADFVPRKPRQIGFTATYSF